jgi:hypothetical protein
MASIPMEERSPLLKELAFDLYLKIGRYHVERKLPVQENPLRFALAPWLNLVNLNTEERSALTARAQLLQSLGIDGQKYISAVEEILQSDHHLMSCCGFANPLIDHLDRHLGVMLPINLRNHEIDEAERRWNGFCNMTYAGPLRLLTYTHLYNFKADTECMEIGAVRVERLSTDRMVRILGGRRRVLDFSSAVPEEEYFIVQEEREPQPSTNKWISRSHNRSSRIASVFQLFKPGVVHPTYTVLYFEPDWVASIWLPLVFPTHVGNLRRVPYRNNEAPYHLNMKEIAEVDRWMRFYESIELGRPSVNPSSGFGQMLLRSGSYYLSSLKRESGPERLVDLAISMESMFTPRSANGELTFRITQNLAQLLGDDATSRGSIQESAKLLYKRRSQLLHGQYDFAALAEGRFVNDDELDEWSDLIRRALVRLCILYFRGASDREKLLSDLGQSALDPALAERLREQINIDRFLSELNLLSE